MNNTVIYDNLINDVKRHFVYNFLQYYACTIKDKQFQRFINECVVYWKSNNELGQEIAEIDITSKLGAIIKTFAANILQPISIETNQQLNADVIQSALKLLHAPISDQVSNTIPNTDEQAWITLFQTEYTKLKKRLNTILVAQKVRWDWLNAENDDLLDFSKLGSKFETKNFSMNSNSAYNDKLYEGGNKITRMSVYFKQHTYDWLLIYHYLITHPSLSDSLIRYDICEKDELEEKTVSWETMNRINHVFINLNYDYNAIPLRNITYHNHCIVFDKYDGLSGEEGKGDSNLSTYSTFIKAHQTYSFDYSSLNDIPTVQLPKLALLQKTSEKLNGLLRKHDDSAMFAVCLSHYKNYYPTTDFTIFYEDCESEQQISNVWNEVKTNWTPNPKSVAAPSKTIKKVKQTTESDLDDLKAAQLQALQNAKTSDQTTKIKADLHAQEVVVDSNEPNLLLDDNNVLILQQEILEEIGVNDPNTDDDLAKISQFVSDSSKKVLPLDPNYEAKSAQVLFENVEIHCESVINQTSTPLDYDQDVII